MSSTRDVLLKEGNTLPVLGPDGNNCIPSTASIKESMQDALKESVYESDSTKPITLQKSPLNTKDENQEKSLSTEASIEEQFSGLKWTLPQDMAVKYEINEQEQNVFSNMSVEAAEAEIDRLLLTSCILEESAEKIETKCSSACVAMSCMHRNTSKEENSTVKKEDKSGIAWGSSDASDVKEFVVPIHEPIISTENAFEIIALPTNNDSPEQDNDEEKYQSTSSANDSFEILELPKEEPFFDVTMTSGPVEDPVIKNRRIFRNTVRELFSLINDFEENLDVLLSCKHEIRKGQAVKDLLGVTEVHNRLKYEHYTTKVYLRSLQQDLPRKKTLTLLLETFQLMSSRMTNNQDMVAKLKNILFEEYSSCK